MAKTFGVIEGFVAHLREQDGMAVQMLIFNKGDFKTPAEAKKWATGHKFVAEKVEETSDSFRIAQRGLDRFKDGTIRTVELTGGVKAVIGKAAEGMTEEVAPWFVQEMPPEPRAFWIEAFNASWEKHVDLDDDLRKMQAMSDGDKAVRDAGWVTIAGTWMKESKEAVSDQDVDELPDSAFGLIEDGGEKDAEGKTRPRTLRHFPYRDKAGQINTGMLRRSMALAESSKLEPELKRKAQTRLRAVADEAGVQPVRESTKGAINLDGTVLLTEATYDGKKGELVAILIEAGTNPAKKRHYPRKVVEAAAPNFGGLKMYINHPTAREEHERPERDLRDWAATIVESWGEDGKAMARIAVHDKWLKEILEDDVARKNIGLSINCKGQFYMGEINGEQMQIVEKIIVEKGPGKPSSVDWVTEPGARGRVVQVFESRREDMAMLESITLADLKQHRPELIQALEAETRAKPKKEEGNVDEKALLEAAAAAGRKAGEDRFNEMREAARKEAEGKNTLKAKLESVVREVTAKPEFLIPEKAKTRIIESLVERTFADDAAMKAAVESAVTAEKQYLKEVAGVKISTGGSGSGEQGSGVKALSEGMQSELETRAHVAGEKEDKE